MLLNVRHGTKHLEENNRKLDFVENSNLIIESLEAAVHGSSGINSQKINYGGFLWW